MVVASSGIGVFAMGELVQVLNMMMRNIAEVLRQNMLRENCKGKYLEANIARANITRG